MGLAPKIRFTVFARDKFTCQYCGRVTPEVILEVDHVVPRAEGGTDELVNLVTSCFECNRGKGALILETITPDTDLHEQAVLVAEREMQIKEYVTVRRRQREREDQDIAELLCYWGDLRGGYYHKYPADATLRKWLKVLIIEDIREAMEIAVERKGCKEEGIAYLYGILKNKAAQQSEM